MKLRNPNKISLIKSNIIHKSESEQTIKTGLLYASNQKILDNPVNKPLNNDVHNFNAPLSRRQSEKILINMNGNVSNPKLNQQIKTPSNSNKNLIEINDNNFNYNNPQYIINNSRNNMNNFKNLNENNYNYNIDSDLVNNNNNNDNNNIPNLNNFSIPDSNKNSKSKNNSTNNIISLNNSNLKTNLKIPNQIPIKYVNIFIPENERVYRSNNNIALVRRGMNLTGLESALSKSDNYGTNMKSKSNPLLQYVTIGVKSNEEYKRRNNDNYLIDNSSSRRRHAKKAGIDDKEKSNINAFSVYASSTVEKSKKILEKGIFVAKENYRTILGMFLILGGSAFVFKVYQENPDVFIGMFDSIKNIVPKKISEVLSKFFNWEYIKENVFTVCVLTAVLIALMFVILKYREHVRFSKIAKQDYLLIKQILEASRFKEDNCDLIGLFENNLVQENSERHKLSEDTYKKLIMPIMQEKRIKEGLIEEGEILIQDQAQKVWRWRRDNNNIVNNDDINHQIYKNQINFPNNV